MNNQRVPFRTRSPIGVDIDARNVRAVQLKFASGRWRLEAAVCYERPEPSVALDTAELAQLACVLDRQGFVGRHIVLAMPEDKLIGGVLEVPPRSSGAPVEEIVAAELARMNNVDAQSVTVGCWDLPSPLRPKDTAQVLAIACRNDDALGMLDKAQFSGLEVEALDAHLPAIVRACGPILPTEGVSAVLALEWEWAMLAVLFHGTVVYSRQMNELGMARLTQVIGRKLNLAAEEALCLVNECGASDGQAELSLAAEAVATTVKSHAEAIAGEMKSPFTYVTTQYGGGGPKTLVICGPGAQVPGMPQHFATLLGVPVQAAQASNLVDLPRGMEAWANDASLATAIGLAQFGAA